MAINSRLLETNLIPIKIFNMQHTFESAQPLTFYADYYIRENMIKYPSNGRILELKHSGSINDGSISAIGSNTIYALQEVKKRFRLQDRMNYIYSKIDTDTFMSESIKKYFGMRVTMNDPWETTVVFIISQFNNVKRIRLITKKLMEHFGTPIYDEHNMIIGHNFPTIESIAKASETDIMSCGPGFRGKYLKSAAQTCMENLDLYSLNGKNYYKIKDALMSVHGIGEKVADCIALMGYGKTEAFPIDRWVKRVMERIYFKKEQKIDKIADFANSRWGKYAGYAQQYIFWNGRSIGVI